MGSAHRDMGSGDRWSRSGSDVRLVPVRCSSLETRGPISETERAVMARRIRVTKPKSRRRRAAARDERSPARDPVPAAVKAARRAVDEAEEFLDRTAR